MTKNTELWDKLGKTDPSQTKQFTRAGGFKGTAIKPMWSYRRMTEEFGPCGVGWGINEPSFQVVPAGEEVLVYCTVSIWFNGSVTGVATEMQSIFGVGGDKVLSKTSSGVRSDDEAFKKAYTDAVTNALKMIGVGADVHMGLFDDSKYVNSMNEEFSSQEPKKPKNEEARKAYKYLQDDMRKINSVDDMRRWFMDADVMELRRKLPDDWDSELKKEWMQRGKELATASPEKQIADAVGGIIVDERYHSVLEAGQ